MVGLYFTRAGWMDAGVECRGMQVPSFSLNCSSRLGLCIRSDVSLEFETYLPQQLSCCLSLQGGSSFSSTARPVSTNDFTRVGWMDAGVEYGGMQVPFFSLNCGLGLFSKSEVSLEFRTCLPQQLSCCLSF